jgi:hypothetical protein
MLQLILVAKGNRRAEDEIFESLQHITKVSVPLRD